MRRAVAVTRQPEGQEASVVMGEVVQLRPLVLGYARLAPFAGHGQHTVVQAQLSSHAQSAGLQLGTVYFGRTGSLPLFDHADAASAYTSLIASLKHSQASGVLVPSLTAFGDERDKRIAELEDDLGVVVRAVDADVHDPAISSRPMSGRTAHGPCAAPVLPCNESPPLEEGESRE